MSELIPLSFPDITEAEQNAVCRVLRSGRLSQGPYLDRFEPMVAQTAGRNEGVGVSSGTAGLHLALLALGVGPGDEVVVPAFSFVATANAVEYVGATPVFADCDPRTLNLKAGSVDFQVDVVFSTTPARRQERRPEVDAAGRRPAPQARSLS